MKKVELHTERLLLRAPVMADVEQIPAARQDPGIQRWVPIPVPHSETDALSYVRDYSDRGWESDPRQFDSRRSSRDHAESENMTVNV